MSSSFVVINGVFGGVAGDSFASEAGTTEAAAFDRAGMKSLEIISALIVPSCELNHVREWMINDYENYSNDAKAFVLVRHAQLQIH